MVKGISSHPRLSCCITCQRNPAHRNWYSYWHSHRPWAWVPKQRSQSQTSGRNTGAWCYRMTFSYIVRCCLRSLHTLFHLRAQKIATKNVCMYSMFLKCNAIFTLLLLPSFNHRFPKLFPQCKSKRHSNSVSYLPVLLKSSQQLVVTLYFSEFRLTSCTIFEGSVLIDLKIYESGNPWALAHSLTEIIRFCWFHKFNWRGRIKCLITTRTQGCNGQEDLSPGATCVTAHLKCLSPSIRPKYAEKSAE